VLVRPYHGLWIEPFDSDQPELDGLARVRSPVRAGSGKVLIVVDAPKKWTSLEVAVQDSSSTISTGRVLDAGNENWPSKGARVVFSNFHPFSHQLGVDRIDDGVVAVPLDHLYAVLRSSGYEACQVRFFGAMTPWRESILMVWRKKGTGAPQLSNSANDGEGTWFPIAPWVLIERGQTPHHGIHLPEIVAARLRHRARVMKCGSGEIPDGAEVLLEADPNGALSFDLGDMRRDCQLVREKAIWAVLSA
jgi:hypothetical protein